MPNETLTLRLMATTDLHGNYLNYDYYKNEKVDQFGLISLAEVIQEAREEIRNNLLFDNGDLLQGSPLADYMRDFALAHEHPAFTLMNALNYDAATLGNHEFNFGIQYLESILPQANFPYLCANLIKENGTPWIMPYIILERPLISDQENIHLLKIGVIGVLPPQILKWDKNHFDRYAEAGNRFITLDIKETVETYVAKLQVEKVDLIVVLAHTGYSTDPYEQGAENSAYYLTKVEGVDAVIAGHQHRRFPSDDFMDERDNHFDLERGLINGVPSVMAGSWSRYLGVIDFKLERLNHRWLIKEQSAHLRNIVDYLPKSQPINQFYWTLLEPAHNAVQEQLNVAVGESKSEFYSYLSLLQDDNCVQIVSDAQLYYARTQLDDILNDYSELPLISAVPLFKVGGRKDDPTYFTEIPQGKISFKNIADLYVYPNQLVILKINGRDLKEWLECCASIYHTIDSTDLESQYLINWREYRSYNVDVIKGINYQIDITQAPRYDGDLHLLNDKSERISTLNYQGQAIQADDQFLLVTNSYRALVDRFPGAGRENTVAITQTEIPDVIRIFIENEVKQKGCLKIDYANNWSLDRVKIEGLTLLLETSNNHYAEEYITTHSQYRAKYFGQDPDDFSLYQFTV